MDTLNKYVALAVSFVACPLAAQSPARQCLSAVDQIVLLPVVDGRVAKTPKINLEKLREHAQKNLQKKGYAVVMSDSAPAEAPAMAVTLDGVGSQGLNPTARVSAKLYDNLRRVIWEGAGSGAYHSPNEQPVAGVQRPQDQMTLATAGALTDLLFQSAGWARGEAVDNALFNLLKGVPSRTQPQPKVTAPPQGDSQRRAALADAFSCPMDATGVDLHADVRETSAGIDVTLRVDTKSIHLEMQGDRWVGKLDLLFAQKDAQGNQVSGIDDALALNLRGPSYDRIQREGLIYHKVVARAAGASELRVVARDASTGAVGSMSAPLTAIP